MIRVIILLFTFYSLLSCSSSNKLRIARDRYNKLDSLYRLAQNQLGVCQDLLRDARNKGDIYDGQLGAQRNYNSQLMTQLKDLSVITSVQAESISKSLENINSQDAYINNLQSAIARKDSLTKRLVMNLKGAVGNLNDKDIDIKIEKGVVYIDISDKLLFNSGSYDVSENAKVVLGKVAKVLLHHSDLEFMVEGHTDNVPYHNGILIDNWDLSVKRANAVVRILKNQYRIPPSQMSAVGRSEYFPIASNTTANGRAKNRRTRIVVLPQLDQFFKLMEHTR